MPKWVRKGGCIDCGYCCVFAINRSKLFMKAPSEQDREFLLTRGFKPTVTPTGEVGLEIMAEAYVPCPQHQNNRCAIYDKRPEACKIFPQYPEQIVGTPCSYWFEDEEGKEKPIGGDASPYARRWAEFRNMVSMGAMVPQEETK